VGSQETNIKRQKIRKGRFFVIKADVLKRIDCLYAKEFNQERNAA